MLGSFSPHSSTASSSTIPFCTMGDVMTLLQSNSCVIHGTISMQVISIIIHFVFSCLNLPFLPSWTTSWHRESQVPRWIHVCLWQVMIFSNQIDSIIVTCNINASSFFFPPISIGLFISSLTPHDGGGSNVVVVQLQCWDKFVSVCSEWWFLLITSIASPSWAI